MCACVGEGVEGKTGKREGSSDRRRRRREKNEGREKLATEFLRADNDEQVYYSRLLL